MKQAASVDTTRSETALPRAHCQRLIQFIPAPRTFPFSALAPQGPAITFDNPDVHCEVQSSPVKRLQHDTMLLCEPRTQYRPTIIQVTIKTNTPKSAQHAATCCASRASRPAIPPPKTTSARTASNASPARTSSSLTSATLSGKILPRRRSKIS
jgi:hypothetical protein